MRRIEMRRVNRTRRIVRCRNVGAAALDTGLSCQMCGVTPDDIDEVTGRFGRFHIGRVAAQVGGEKETLVVCSSCYQGAIELCRERITGGSLSLVGAGPDAQAPVVSALIQKIASCK
jgi:hypothetical protein